MEQVFAPWRIEWVEREGGEIDGCAFCELPEWDDATESRVVARNDHAFVLLNNYPYNPGHAMVIPFEHVDDVRDLDDETLLAQAHLKQRTLEALETAMGPDGFNTGTNLGGSAAGGSIDDHVHAHVVPRWEGDTNFMPVVSDTKVIVEAVDDTYRRLHAAFAEQEGASVTDAETPVEF